MGAGDGAQGPLNSHTEEVTAGNLTNVEGVGLVRVIGEEVRDLSEIIQAQLNNTGRGFCTRELLTLQRQAPHGLLAIAAQPISQNH